MPTPIANGLKDIFLAGIGAMAITGEKASEMVDKLIARGELTVDQGKEINQELQHKAEDTLDKVRVDALEAAMAAMTPEERAAFAAKAGRDRREARGRRGRGRDTGRSGRRGRRAGRRARAGVRRLTRERRFRRTTWQTTRC